MKMLDNVHMRHLVSVDGVDMEEVESLMESASYCRALVQERGGCRALAGTILAMAFFKPSTRTSCSFTAATMRLGGTVLALDAGSSSSKKGESVSDTAQVHLHACLLVQGYRH